MRNLIVGLGCLLALIVGSYAHLAPRCQHFWTEFDGSCYRVSNGGFISHPNRGLVYIEEGRTQRSANDYCRSEKPGAALVTINSQLENDFIYEWVLSSNRDPQPIWLGLYVNPMTMGWEWFSGEPVEFTNWAELHMYPEFGAGVLLFDASVQNPVQNAFEISPKWKEENALGERYPFICEYKLNETKGTTATPPPKPPTRPPGPTRRSAGPTRRPAGPTRRPAGPTRRPAGPTRRPAVGPTANPRGSRPQLMQESNPQSNPLRAFQPIGSLETIRGNGRLAGTHLHEIPRSQRSQRPSAYRQPNLFAAFP